MKRLNKFKDELDMLIFIAAIHTVSTAVVPHLKDFEAFSKVSIGWRRWSLSRARV